MFDEFDLTLTRADNPPSLSKSAYLTIDPAIESVRASSNSDSATSCSALAYQTSRRAIYHLAFASATRLSRSLVEAPDVTPELLELQITI